MTSITGQEISQSTCHAIAALEIAERTTLNEWQREAIRLLVQDDRKSVELIMPRRSGKSYLLQLLMNRVSNNTHIIYGNYHMAQEAIRNGMPEGRVHYYGNLVTLLEVDPPQVILCDECTPDNFILGLRGVEKILSLYTYATNEHEEEARSVRRMVEDGNIWSQEYLAQYFTTKEKEWDDATN